MLTIVFCTLFLCFQLQKSHSMESIVKESGKAIDPEKIESIMSKAIDMKEYYSYGTSRQGITMDPVSIISLLALGAFLIYNILELLRMNSLINASGRSLDVDDLNNALELSDNEAPPFTKSLDPTAQKMNSVKSFNEVVRDVASLHFLASPEEKLSCLRRITCSYASSNARNIISFLLLNIAKIGSGEPIKLSCTNHRSNSYIEDSLRNCKTTVLDNARKTATRSIRQFLRMIESIRNLLP